MYSFVKLCQFALVLNKTLIQPEQEEFQTQLEAGYDSLKRELHVSAPPPGFRFSSTVCVCEADFLSLSLFLDGSRICRT